MPYSFSDLVKKMNTPLKVQKFLRQMDYNRELKGETLKSARAALKAEKSHCFEAAFLAAALLEPHGYPPIILSLESKDGLDHVLFLFEKNGRYGTVGRSRDEGLHGRSPVFKDLRSLAYSYYDPFVDKSGMLKGYQIVSLDEMNVDWRASKKNLWAAEQYLIKLKHIKLPSSKARYQKLFQSYKKNGPILQGPHWW